MINKVTVYCYVTLPPTRPPRPHVPSPKHTLQVDLHSYCWMVSELVFRPGGSGSRVYKPYLPSSAPHHFTGWHTHTKGDRFYWAQQEKQKRLRTGWPKLNRATLKCRGWVLRSSPPFTTHLPASCVAALPYTAQSSRNTPICPSVTSVWMGERLCNNKLDKLSGVTWQAWNAPWPKVNTREGLIISSEGSHPRPAASLAKVDPYLQWGLPIALMHPG